MAARYRLQALLRLKERMKKSAELHLAHAIIRLNEEKRKLEELEVELEEIIESWKQAREEMTCSQVEGVLVVEENRHVNFMRSLKEDEQEKRNEIEAQKQVIEEAMQRVAQARNEYIEASRQLQVMQKHKELWQKKVDGELSRQEARKLDELGNTIHQLKRWRGEKSVFEI